MYETLIVSIPEGSAELLAQAEDAALSFLASRGLTALEAATSSFRREGLLEFGVEGFMESEEAAADAWDELEWVVMEACGVRDCHISLHPSAFQRFAPQRQLG